MDQESRERESEPNPYESPRSASLVETGSAPDVSPRGRWLVKTSLALAIVIEVFPTEVDLLIPPLLHGELRAFFLAKAVCLAAILTPLFAFFQLNSRSGVRSEKGRIIAVGVIVVLNLAMDILALVIPAMR